ncbi:MAG: NUDIX hydrolase [Sneathiella sp.]|nr:NUDIX hydrolase [Sneathiella sp.]
MNNISVATKPVKPRHAASLVLYEKRGTEYYVLMGKRAKGHRFLPDVYVFPGGRVDDEDFDASYSKDLKPDVLTRLSKPGDMGRALATAAIRETYEETGLIIGNVVHGKLQADLSPLTYIVRAITPSHNPIRFDARFMMVDAKHAKGTLGGSGELIDLRWVTLDQALTMQVVDVTEFVLEEVREILAGKTAETLEIPLFTYRNGKAFIRR